MAEGQGAERHREQPGAEAAEPGGEHHRREENQVAVVLPSPHRVEGEAPHDDQRRQREGAAIPFPGWALGHGGPALRHGQDYG